MIQEEWKKVKKEDEENYEKTTKVSEKPKI